MLTEQIYELYLLRTISTPKSQIHPKRSRTKCIPRIAVEHLENQVPIDPSTVKTEWWILEQISDRKGFSSRNRLPTLIRDLRFHETANLSFYQLIWKVKRRSSNFQIQKNYNIGKRSPPDDEENPEFQHQLLVTSSIDSRNLRVVSNSCFQNQVIEIVRTLKSQGLYFQNGFECRFHLPTRLLQLRILPCQLQPGLCLTIDENLNVYSNPDPSAVLLQKLGRQAHLFHQKKFETLDAWNSWDDCADLLMNLYQTCITVNDHYSAHENMAHLVQVLKSYKSNVVEPIMIWVQKHKGQIKHFRLSATKISAEVSKLLSQFENMISGKQELLSKQQSSVFATGLLSSIKLLLADKAVESQLIPHLLQIWKNLPRGPNCLLEQQELKSKLCPLQINTLRNVLENWSQELTHFQTVTGNRFHSMSLSLGHTKLPIVDLKPTARRNSTGKLLLATKLGKSMYLLTQSECGFPCRQSISEICDGKVTGNWELDVGAMENLSRMGVNKVSRVACSGGVVLQQVSRGPTKLVLVYDMVQTRHDCVSPTVGTWTYRETAVDGLPGDYSSFEHTSRHIIFTRGWMPKWLHIQSIRRWGDIGNRTSFRLSTATQRATVGLQSPVVEVSDGLADGSSSAAEVQWTGSRHSTQTLTPSPLFQLAVLEDSECFFTLRRHPETPEVLVSCYSLRRHSLSLEAESAESVDWRLGRSALDWRVQMLSCHGRAHCWVAHVESPWSVSVLFCVFRNRIHSVPVSARPLLDAVPDHHTTLHVHNLGPASTVRLEAGRTLVVTQLAIHW